MHILNFSYRSWVHKLHYHVIYIPTFAQSEIQRGMISLSLLGNNSGLSQMILVRLLCCIKHYFHSLIKKTIYVLRVCVHISDDRTYAFFERNFIWIYHLIEKHSSFTSVSVCFERNSVKIASLWLQLLSVGSVLNLGFLKNLEAGSRSLV